MFHHTAIGWKYSPATRPSDVKFLEALHHVRDSLSHWNDAVAVSKAFVQLQMRTASLSGILSIGLEEHKSLRTPDRDRGLYVLVTFRAPITKEVEDRVRYTVMRVNFRYRTDMRVRIVSQPPENESHVTRSGCIPPQ
jgi:hypothetical protein